MTNRAQLEVLREMHARHVRDPDCTGCFLLSELARMKAERDASWSELKVSNEVGLGYSRELTEARRLREEHDGEMEYHADRVCAERDAALAQVQQLRKAEASGRNVIIKALAAIVHLGLPDHVKVRGHGDRELIDREMVVQEVSRIRDAVDSLATTEPKLTEQQTTKAAALRTLTHEAPPDAPGVDPDFATEPKPLSDAGEHQREAWFKQGMPSGGKVVMELQQRITELEAKVQQLREALGHATTHLPEDRGIIRAALAATEPKR